RDLGRDDPELGLDERHRRQALLLASLVLRARLIDALLPVREVLAHAGAQLRAAGRVRVDLEEAEDRRDAPEEAEARARGRARRVGIVAEGGVLGGPRGGGLGGGAAGGVR